MTGITYYPLGNAGGAFITTEQHKRFIFDFADMRDPNDVADKRIDLPTALKDDLGWPDVKEVDVLAITHGDNDHVKGIPENFWLEHAGKYQSDDRIKFKELWVPAALIVEEGSEDDTRVVRAEARHRFLKKEGIRVFSRPEKLRAWLETKGKDLEDYRHLITDAGQLVPNFSLEGDGIEFFVHSPFAHRHEQGIEDRNQNCLVMQAVMRSGGRDTRILLTADSIADDWQHMVSITEAHGNEERLSWDVFGIPHHCSYLSMAKAKVDHENDEKTTPTPEFEWLLSQGSPGSIMVSQSKQILAETTTQPAHVETYRRYKETADAFDGDLIVTMEHPSKEKPGRTVVEIGGDGPTVKKGVITSGVSAATTRPPRMG